MKLKTVLVLVLAPSLGFAGPFEHAFNAAAKSAVDRGRDISPSVRSRDKAAAKEAYKEVAGHYESHGYDRANAERIAADKTARAYADIRATATKADIPVERTSLVLYSKSLTRVTVKSSPDGATISINGQPCGKTETSKWLKEDDYTIVAALEGYKTQEKKIRATSGAPETVVFNLER